MRMKTRNLFLLIVGFLLALQAAAALAAGPYGNYIYRKRGIMDGNLVVTEFFNYGMIAKWPNQPGGVWPKGTNHSYVDGVALIVIGSALDEDGNRIHPMSTMYREDMGNDFDPETGRPWGWEPLPGYANPNQDEPAMSDNPDSWPFYWPDRDASWAGFWNGYFGKGVKNADLETYFVMDDSDDKEFAFYPDSTDTLRRGMALQVAVRGFQWSQVLAEDCIFWHYDIKNLGTTDYDSMSFGMLIDWGLGGTNNSADDAGRFDTRLDIAYAWDLDGMGDYGWRPVGYAGFAFLESPGISVDGIDNDEDGLVDERRDSGPGEYVFGSVGIYDEDKWHWSGDEDGDWDAFTDRNGNGVRDPDEPLNDDLGRDGIGPVDDGYFGPDAGEGDGMPTFGEPDFDALDKDESDQIGLTAFHIFPLHQYALHNEEENWELSKELVDPTDDQLQSGVNLGMMFFSGTFPLETQLQERFSMSLLFGNDLDDLTRNKETVQAIYNANYNFAQPPRKPTLQAVAGDGRVVLYWDETAENSYDRFLQEYDFEGYRVYRSTDPSFIDTRLITDAYGNITFRKPLEQYDLRDGRTGPHPVSVFGAHFDLGTDTGLRHTFIDTTVTNGFTYYYAVVSYDYGKISGETIVDTLVVINPDGTLRDSLIYYFVPRLDENGNITGIPPSECTSTIIGDVGGNVQLDINTAAVTPDAPAAGYIRPELKGGLRHTAGEATGDIDINILFPDSLVDGRTYLLNFLPAETYQGLLPFARSFVLIDSAGGDTIFRGDSLLFGYWGPFEDGDPTFWQSTQRRAWFFKPDPDSTIFWHQVDVLVETPLIDGMTITMKSDLIDYATQEDLGIDSVYWVGSMTTNYSSDIRILPELDRISLKVPFNFEVRWVDEDTVLTQRLFGGAYDSMRVNFMVWNTTLDEQVPFGYRPEYFLADEDGDGEPDDTLLYDFTILPIVDLDAPIFTWAFKFFAPPEAIDTTIVGLDTTYTINHVERLPAPGEVLRLKVPIPFGENDSYAFTVGGPGYDKTLAKQDLDRIAVVPNPYVAAVEWEPRVSYTTGRGPRKIDFIHLPARCTIRIYTLSGFLVKTLEHNTVLEDGSESWNLVSKDGMDIAYGVYIYHVDAPGIGEHIGKFAVIK